MMKIRNPLSFLRKSVLMGAAATALTIPTGLMLETRDGPEAPSIKEINEAVEGLLKTFEEFKSANDERIQQIEQKGSADTVTVEKVEKLSAEIDKMKSIREELDKLKKRAARGRAINNGSDFTKEDREHYKAFSQLMRNPEDSKARAEYKQAEEAARQAAQVSASEARAVSTLLGGSGGYAVPEMIARQLEEELQEIFPLRNLVDVRNVGTKDYKQLVNTHGADYGWVGETDVRAETATSNLEEVAPTFGTLYAYPRATEESLDDIFFDVGRWILDETLDAFRMGEEVAMINGDGSKKPTGFLQQPQATADDDTRAFGTIQTVASGAAAGFKPVTADDSPADAILDLIYKLKSGYRSNARFLMNRATAGQVRKFKDGEGNYLWQPSAQLGQPDRLFSYAVAESEQMPDVAADATPIAFGDFRAGYMLCNLVGLRITRDEVTTPGYVKWYLRRRLGGITKKSEAIKLLKIEA
ncbi:MAG: phage major capsid protein [Henriciella sp.]|nr:phage major capsid protein [Henriciella sp.]